MCVCSMVNSAFRLRLNAVTTEADTNFTLIIIPSLFNVFDDGVLRQLKLISDSKFFLCYHLTYDLELYQREDQTNRKAGLQATSLSL